jgi:hypothetical protein
MGSKNDDFTWFYDKPLPLDNPGRVRRVLQRFFAQLPLPLMPGTCGRALPVASYSVRQ